MGAEQLLSGYGPTRVSGLARDLGLDALVIPTLSGRSVRLVSAHRVE